jgi:hypothetical protein
MTLARLTAWTLLAAIGFGLVYQPVTAQDPPLPTKKADALEAVSTYKEGESRGIPTAVLPTVQKQFLAFANYYGEMVKHPLVYKHAQDPSVKDPSGRTIFPLDGVGGIIPDMQRFIVEPIPFNASRVTKDRGDYIRELGIAFDNVLKPIINENPERIVRINATRMLAAACKSGATAHYPTVTALLTNATTPPDVKHYALVAAGNLLSAYDVYNYRSRRHSNGWKNDQQKGAGDKELAELVVAIEKHVTDPAAIMTNVQNFKAAETPPDQKEVVRFIRRQAIRALGEVRFAAIPAADGKTLLYPAYTLARVCVSDPTLLIEPSPTECAEAAIGLTNMSPIRDSDILKDYEVETLVEAITVALITFAERRAANKDDKSIDWRGYALRLSEGLKTWRLLFDFGFNPMQPNTFPGKTPPAVDDLAQRVQTNLLTPIESGGNVDMENLKSFLRQLRDRPNPKPLFSSNPATALNAQNPTPQDKK